MPRNLYERVEVLFPLKDEHLRQRIITEILPAYLADNQKARILGSEGLYTYVHGGRKGKGFSVQEHLMRLAENGVNPSDKTNSEHSRVAYTGTQDGAAPSEPAVTTDLEVQDSLNATV